MKQTTSKKSKGKPRSKPIKTLVPMDSPYSFSLMPHIVRPNRVPRGENELKVFDTAISVTTPTTTAFLFNCFTPSQGVALNQRTGDIVYVKNVEMVYTCNAANADLFSSLRVMLFQWRPNAGLIAPVSSDILQVSADGIYAFLDVPFGDQYHVFYDHLHCFAGLAAAPTSSTNQGMHRVFSPGSFTPKVNFGFSLTTAANSIWLLAVSDSAIAPTPNLSFKARISFEEN